MSMHVHKLVTHLTASDALSVIDVLDQLREVLMASYGDDIQQMLKDAQRSDATSLDSKTEPIDPLDDDLGDLF